MRDSVLLVDDEPNILRAYKRHLGNVFALQTATNAEEALQLFENAGPFAVIVSDLRMPGKDGIQLLREVKERYPDTGRILLTGHGDFESVASAVNEGGIHQYLTKPTPADLLGRSIEASLKNHERQMTMRAAVERLNNEKIQNRARQTRTSRFDTVTGLLNRKAASSAMSSWLEERREHAEVGTIAIADIDRFSDLNATYGERAGDHVLSVVADRVASLVEDHSIVSRWDGDAILFTMNFGESTVLVEMFLTRLVEFLQADIVFEGETIPVSVSVGAAPTPLDDSGLAATVRHAEVALARAQKDGPSVISIHQEGTRAATGTITGAFQRGEFEFRFQPQIDLDTGDVIGAEALLRRRHPHFGLQPPAVFMEQARRENLLVPISAWAVEEACRTLKRWERAEGPLSLAVNVSASYAATPGFVESVRTAIRETEIEPHRLELEITESEELSRNVSIGEAMNGLRALGVVLTIDDFGAEYATIGNLIDFSFDKMKVNKDFVDRMRDDPKVDAIMHWIAALSRANGMALVAEGVESQEQLARLQSLGYNYAQGYHIAPPLTETKLMEWIASRQ